MLETLGISGCSIIVVGYEGHIYSYSWVLIQWPRHSWIIVIFWCGGVGSHFGLLIATHIVYRRVGFASLMRFVMCLVIGEFARIANWRSIPSVRCKADEDGCFLDQYLQRVEKDGSKHTDSDLLVCYEAFALILNTGIGSLEICVRKWLIRHKCSGGDNNKWLQLPRGRVMSIVM